MVAAAGDWVAVAREADRARWILKPLVLALLIGAATVLPGGPPGVPRVAVIVALGLSLAGDVFLLRPERWFLPGLAAFLGAHVAYVVAFNPTAPPAVPAIVSGALLLVIVVPLFLRFLRGMRATGEGVMAVPVAVYVLALGAVVVSAAATFGRPEWAPGRSALALAGALVFASSDGHIGWTRFVGPLRWAPVYIIVSYHLAQAALVLALLG